MFQVLEFKRFAGFRGNQKQEITSSETIYRNRNKASEAPERSQKYPEEDVTLFKAKL